MTTTVDEAQPALPAWLTEDPETGVATVNGIHLRYEMFAVTAVGFNDATAAQPVEYLEAAYRWILDRTLPGKPPLSAIKGGKE